MGGEDRGSQVACGKALPAALIVLVGSRNVLFVACNIAAPIYAISMYASKLGREGGYEQESSSRPLSHQILTVSSMPLETNLLPSIGLKSCTESRLPVGSRQVTLAMRDEEGTDNTEHFVCVAPVSSHDQHTCLGPHVPETHRGILACMHSVSDKRCDQLHVAASDAATYPAGSQEQIWTLGVDCQVIDCFAMADCCLQILTKSDASGYLGQTGG